MALQKFDWIYHKTLKRANVTLNSGLSGLVPTFIAWGPCAVGSLVVVVVVTKPLSSHFEKRQTLIDQTILFRS